MNVLQTVLKKWFPVHGHDDTKLREREAKAEEEASSGFDAMHQARLDIQDKRRQRVRSGFSEIDDEIDEADEMMQRALGKRSSAPG